jgi:hypothetical protein
MIAGTLSNGFEVEVDEKVVKTYRFARLIGRAASKDDNERIYANSKILSFLIGEKGEEELLDYVKKQTGEEPTEEEITALTIEMINLMKKENEEIKKSSSSAD